MNKWRAVIFGGAFKKFHRVRKRNENGEKKRKEKKRKRSGQVNCAAEPGTIGHGRVRGKESWMTCRGAAGAARGEPRAKRDAGTDRRTNGRNATQTGIPSCSVLIPAHLKRRFCRRLNDRVTGILIPPPAHWRTLLFTLYIRHHPNQLLCLPYSVATLSL